MLRSHITKKTHERMSLRGECDDDKKYIESDDTDGFIEDGDEYRDYSGDATNMLPVHVIQQIHEFDDLDPSAGFPSR